MYWNHGQNCPDSCLCKETVKYISTCSGQLIPQYKIKYTTINARTNPGLDAINRIAVDGDLHTYISYEEIGAVCIDCKKKDCSSSNEKI